MEIINLIISLISGILGGNVAGAALPNKSLGTLGNSLSGLVGGGLGGYLLQALELAKHTTEAAGGAAGTAANAVTSTGLDIGSILANVGSSGVGGAVLMIIVGLIKSALSKSA